MVLAASVVPYGKISDYKTLIIDRVSGGCLFAVQMRIG
jgi:hypothetical protein